MSDFDVAAEDAAEAEDFEAQAREAFEEDKLPRALTLIDRALELAPKSFDAWSFKAKIYAALELPDGALDAIDHALALVPDDYDALATKSGILSMLAGDLESGLAFARAAYDAMLREVPPDGRSDPDGDDFYAVENVYESLYYALYRLGKNAEAEQVRAEAASYGHRFDEGVEEDAAG